MFGFLVNIFNIILYLPLFNLLILIYNYLPLRDFGLAILCLTIIIRLILYPISVKALNSQRALQKIQPKIQELQKKYKDDRERQTKETLELYKTEKVNPFSGLLLAIIQLPILIALYRVFWQGLKPEELGNLYGFIANPININVMFLGLINLSQPNIIFAVLAGLTQFVQTKMLLPKQSNSKEKDVSQIMQKQMIYFLPVITVVILFRLPSALGLYWTISSVFSIIQQYFLIKEPSKN